MTALQKGFFHREGAALAPGAHLPRVQVPGSAGENTKIFEEEVQDRNLFSNRFEFPSR